MIYARLFMLILALAGGLSTTNAVAITITSTVLYKPGTNWMPFTTYIADNYKQISKDQYIAIGYGPITGYNYHALYWNGTSTVTDLHPAGAIESYALGTGGNQQVGYITELATGTNPLAAAWSGSAETYTSLHPVGYTSSAARDSSGSQQVGYVSGSSTGDMNHAALWYGSADSIVDLNPAGAINSEAYGTDGIHQVGIIANHAALWSGTADSVIDLNPASFAKSYAIGVYDNQQVGYVLTNNRSHAAVWNGSAESFFDLHPTGEGDFLSSQARETNGTIQVGFVSIGTSFPYSRKHAALWNGTAESYIDLHALLPEDYSTSSAYSIVGNKIYGLATGTDGFKIAQWTIATTAGDVNFDDVVDISDYNNVIKYFGSSGMGDANFDDIVDISDYNDVINYFGQLTAGSFVPEPAGLTLLSLGAMGLLARRRNA